MTVDKSSGEIVVARDDAIYLYGANGRGPSFAYEGPKRLLRVFENYVAIVSPPKPSPQTKSSALRRFVGGRADDIFNTSTFALLDTDLKYVAHTESITFKVRTIFVEWGDLFILTREGKVGTRSYR